MKIIEITIWLLAFLSRINASFTGRHSPIYGCPLQLCANAANGMSSIDLGENVTSADASTTIEVFRF